jgi:hypothetical protein
MCGNAEANSSEHRLKKSDIVRAYGRGAYKGGFAPVHVSKSIITDIQGANSSTLKYAKTICHTCNATTSQPFDFAYDNFITWVLENETSILHRRFINFAEVFGLDFETSQRNLYKYFAKSFGCRLVDAGRNVPQDIVVLLDKTQFQTNLRITFSINEDILLMPINDRNSFIGKGDLYKMVLQNNPEQITGYIWNEHVSWFTTYYWYDQYPDGDLGSTWTANSQHIYLGSHKPLSPEMRVDFLEKLSSS